MCPMKGRGPAAPRVAGARWALGGKGLLSRGNDLPVQKITVYVLSGVIYTLIKKKKKATFNFFFFLTDSLFILVYAYHITDTEFVL